MGVIRQEQIEESAASDVELARTLAATISGQVCEWPQLKPLLDRLADQLATRTEKTALIVKKLTKLLRYS